MNVNVLIAGAGPAGLAAGIELRRLGVGRVLIADREAEAGGVPRHSAHTGYGLRDLRRVMTGPAYARHYARAAVEAGAEVRAGTTVTGWPGWAGPGGATGRTGSTDPGGDTRRTGPTDPGGDTRPTGPTDPDGPTGRSSFTGPAGPVGPGAPRGPISVTLTSADGIETVTASAVLLATGCRERPRAARLVPGGLAARRDDHRGAAAAGLPPRAAAARPRPGRRRGACELLGDGHARARGRRCPRAGHRPAAAPELRRVRARRRGPLADPGLDGDGGAPDSRPRPAGGGRAGRSAHRRHPVRRLRHGRLHRRLDPRP